MAGVCCVAGGIMFRGRKGGGGMLKCRFPPCAAGGKSARPGHMLGGRCMAGACCVTGGIIFCGMTGGGGGVPRHGKYMPGGAPAWP